MATHEALGARYSRFAKEWLEYVASVVQLDLMEPQLRSLVLANFPDARPFASPEQVNPIVYGFAPEEFAVRAYLHARANGGSAFIARILEGNVDFDTDQTMWMR